MGYGRKFPSGTHKRRASSVSASSQNGRSVSPISNFSRPTSSAPPVPQLPRITQRPPLPNAAALDSSFINFHDGHSFVNDGMQQWAAQRRESLKHLPNGEAQPAYVKKRFIPSETYPRIPVPQRESFDISEVPVSVARPQRAAYVQSMAVSTHGAESLCSSRISRVQDEHDEWWMTDPVELLQPLKPRPSSPISRTRAKTTAFDSISGAESLNRAFTFPNPAEHASEVVHPSSRILLSDPSPRVRAVMTTRRGLLTALETATLPSEGGVEPIPWWQAWPEPRALKPLPTRTLDILRTSNIDATPICAGNSPTPGQGTHFERLTPYRFCTRTRTHGPETDFSHPSFCGSVAGRRAMWMSAYREANYTAPLANFDTGVLEPPRRETPWQGHWLQRGTTKGARRMRDGRREETDGQEGQELHDEPLKGGIVGYHRRGWSTQSVQSTVHSMQRVGSKMSRCLGFNPRK